MKELLIYYFDHEFVWFLSLRSLQSFGLGVIEGDVAIFVRRSVN